MLTDTEVPELTFPMRVAWDTFSNKKRNGQYAYEQSKEQSLSWFRDRIRPAVMEWVAIAAEEQSKYDAARATILEIAGKEAPYTENKLEQIVKPKRTPAEIIDEYLRVASADGIAFRQNGLAREASKISATLPEEERAKITPAAISKIYHCDNLGPRIRYCVAMAINKKVPCSADDLLWPEDQVRNDHNSNAVTRKSKMRPRNSVKSH